MVPEGRAGRAVLIVGGGVAGMHAALVLAGAGVRVHVVDSAPTVGGMSNLLDKTFPTQACGVCHMAPQGPAYCPAIEVGKHPRIRLMVNSSLTHVSGSVGEFLVRVETQPEFVRKDMCDSCGECEKACSVVVEPPAYLGFPCHKAIYRPGQRAVPGGYALEETACTRCGKCVDACPCGAVDLLAKATTTDLQVGAIIVSAGAGPCDPRVRREYSYDPSRNVITGLELERIMSASGPTAGRLERPSDGLVPSRVAFVQCAGSRDISRGSAYCSSVCCMYALKEAMNVKARIPGGAVRIFFTDIRAMGKGYEEYYQRARSLGVEFENCRVAAVEERGGVIRVLGEAGGTAAAEEFDLVVLSTGFVPSPDLRRLAQMLGVELGPFGFVQPLLQGRSPVETSRPGVFVCGGAAEPTDIPASVVWSGACALQALRAVGPEPDGDEWPQGEEAAAPERVSGQGASSQASPVAEPGEQRIGVFVCRCGSPMAGLQLDEMVRAARGIDGVTVAREIPEVCKPPGLEALRREVGAGKLTKVVVAACSPRDILGVVEEGLAGVGIPSGLVEVANVREQCAWVHKDVEAATAKAHDLVAMAVEQVRLAKPLQERTRAIPPGAVVIGGGAAGMQAAASLADLGHEVHLVEKERALGGAARRIRRTLEGADVQEALRRLEGRVRSDSHIALYTGSVVASARRNGGGFAVRIAPAHDEERGPAELDVECGVIVVATGGGETPVPRWLEAPDASRAMTQVELEACLSRGCDIPEDVKSVVMVQCAGSRDGERPYCSRICCSHALKNALDMKAARPDVEVYILHRDVRVSGTGELFYQQAREMGVVFVRYPDDVRPRIVYDDSAGRQAVEVRDETLGEFLRVPADLVVVSVGLEGAAHPELARALGVSFDEHGFFSEANPKVQPVDFLVPGVYVCGLARAPGFVSDAFISAEAAAARAGAYLSARQAHTVANPSRVRERRCVGCGVCVDVCAYGARRIDEEAKVAAVDEFLCRGCGSCQAGCPSGAAEHLGFEGGRIMSVLDVAFG